MTDETQVPGRNEIIEVMARGMAGANVKGGIFPETEPSEAAREYCRATITALNAAGYVIRPKEPTPEMMHAGATVIYDSGGEGALRYCIARIGDEQAGRVYRAMVGE